MTGPVPRPVWELGALLGEGPVWLEAEQALRFVDIHGGRLHRFDPVSGTGNTVQTAGKPSFIVPADGGGMLVGDGAQVRRFDGDALGAAVAQVAESPRNRINDATVDPAGRLWFGTLDEDEESPTGALYCLDRGVLRPTGRLAVITNGPAVSSDGRLLYFVDTLERTIWRIPLNEDGTLAAAGEVFLRLEEHEGFTDGVVLDSEDCLWVGLWEGWGVRRYAPDRTLLAHVALPCARATKVAFGGPGLTTAFVTTARTGLDAPALARQPLAGSLFAFDAPAPGRPVPAVRLA
ncbi:MAG: SMP-30/gluconolactonase/LRE family protein [Novosphingobium sp.]